MQIRVEHQPAYALAVVDLAPGETVIAEAGAMVSMDAHVEVSTQAGAGDQGLVGSLFSGLKRMIAGESFFQNRYTALGQSASATFAPSYPGDIAVVDLVAGRNLLLQSQAFLCGDPRVTLDPKWGGARNFFAGERMIMLRASGEGPLAFQAFGAITEVEVTEPFVVDTGHVVAFEDALQFSIGRFGTGLFSMLASGEGLVSTFRGTGRVWIQSRNPIAFGQALAAHLPPRRG